MKEVSLESAREKNIRHGHISTLHIWWARRPLASSRATNYAALIPASDNIDDWNKKRQFIIEFSKWENSLNQKMIEQARKDILKANKGKPPKVLDPYGGGGAIPLEALRLGCETYSNDLNPVAFLIQKCTLEYPQKYGKLKEKKEDMWMLSDNSRKNPLLEDVKKWGNWVLEEAKKEIGRFYPSVVEEDENIPVGYIWARTIPCQNIICGAEIPLMRQFWLAKKDKKKVALEIMIDRRSAKFKIVKVQLDWKCNKGKCDCKYCQGTVSRAVAVCPVCGSVVDAKTTRKLFQEGKAGQRMIAVVLHKSGKRVKRYRIATDMDMQIFREAEEYLKEKREKLMLEWGIDPVPDEKMNQDDPTTVAGRGYGVKIWGDLFNSRQKLALITFVEKVRVAYHKMLEEGYDVEYAKAVVSYLAFINDKLIEKTSSLCRWLSTSEQVVATFSRQALPMVWDYAEFNTLTNNFIEWCSNTISHLSQISRKFYATVSQASATELPYPDNYFDAVFTDPPYYDNINYAELSDFFYVWLKRMIGDLYPELFPTPLIPKSNEIVANPIKQGGQEEAKKFFEENLKKSFQEIYRVLKPDGIAIIVYAHKSTSGWETLINSLLDSGLIMTCAWPLNTEMGARLNAKETASLASSIYIIARKMKREQTGFYSEVKEELKRHLNKKLKRLWEEGIGGADFFISAIGSAIEVFGKYEKVMDYDGNIIRADRMLGEVRNIATDYAVSQILHNGFSGEISDLTRFYVLYRWNYGGAKVQFDEARKLAQSCSLDLAKEWNRPGFIKKEKEFIRVLGPQDRSIDVLQLKNSSELIDVLHSVLLLWEKSKGDEMINLLKQSGYGNREAFYGVAQAVSETLPIKNKEKKLLDGFLAGRERVKNEIRKKQEQRRLEVVKNEIIS